MLYPFVQNLITGVQNASYSVLRHSYRTRWNTTNCRAMILRSSSRNPKFKEPFSRHHEWFPPLRIRCRAQQHFIVAWWLHFRVLQQRSCKYRNRVRASHSDRIGLRDTDACLFTIKNFSSCVSKSRHLSPIWWSIRWPWETLTWHKWEALRIFGWSELFFVFGTKVFPVQRVIKSNLDGHKRLDSAWKLLAERPVCHREIVDQCSHFLQKWLHTCIGLSLTGYAYFNLGFATPEGTEIVLQVNVPLHISFPIHQADDYVHRQHSFEGRDFELDQEQRGWAHSQFSDFVMTQYGDNTPSKIDLKLPSELAKFLDVSWVLRSYLYLHMGLVLRWRAWSRMVMKYLEDDFRAVKQRNCEHCLLKVLDDDGSK